MSLNGAGPARFAEVARRWRALCAGAAFDPADEPSGAGPVAVGGFAFAPDGGGAPHWRGFEPASLTVPELAIIREERGGRRAVRVTLATLASPDDLPEELLERLERRLAELHQEPLPLLDPAPTGQFQVASAMPPEHYEQAVGRARELIAAGELQKIVLAREVQVHAPSPYDPAAVFGVLRQEFPSCFVFCVGRGDAALIAASPELLVRRQGQRVSTIALAGSTRRSADPAVDDHLGEQLLRGRELPRGARDRRAADRADAAPALGMGDRRTRAGAREDREHPASGHAHPRPVDHPFGRARARRADAPDPGGRR